MRELTMASKANPRCLLRFLEPSEESSLLYSVPPQSFEEGHVICEQDARLRAIFLIVDGTVRVEREEEGQVVPLAILGAGEFFGEMSFVDEAPTSARVVTQEPTRLQIIQVADVDRMGTIDPSFTGRLYRSLAAILVQRLRRTSMLLSLDNRQV
jgi:CRP-like cAMP-binding protein